MTDREKSLRKSADCSLAADSTSSAASGSASGNGKKILNDEHIVLLPVPVMTTVPLSPTKQISMSIAKSKRSTPKKKMDHYVLQTIKNESSEVGDDTIDFILTENDGETTSCAPSGEITEELQLSGEEEEGEGDEKTEEIVEHVCGKCYKTFRRINGLKKHLDFCRFDSGYHLRKAEMLKNLDKIEKDAVIMENKDVCFCCGESYDTFHLGHINCPDCPKSFKSQMSYERHIFITHSEFNDHPCTICNAKLRSANLLKIHLEQHTNRGKPFACKICGRDFTRSYHLKRHQKYSSCSANDNDTMSCKVCNKAFFRLDNLRAHLKQHLGKHVTKKPEYMCPYCKNCFYSLSTLNIHTRTHTGERPFDCDLCDKKFPSLVALKKHRRYHTGEKPYTCSVCNHSFAVKEVLNRHMKRHTGERPHVCTECGKSFIQATQLRTHQKTHIRPFECPECPEKYKTEKQLERHSKTHMYTNRISSRKQNTVCGECGRNFHTIKNLNFHKLKEHETEKPPPNKKHVMDADVEADADISSSAYRFEDDVDHAMTAIADDMLTLPDSNDGADAAARTTTDGGVVVQEFVVDEMSPASSSKQTIILQCNQAYTVIPVDNGEHVLESVSNSNVASVEPKDAKATAKDRKSLGESLAEAIADNDISDIAEEHTMDGHSDEDLVLKGNVNKLLDMLVDNTTLQKFGWPTASEEFVLCKVIENCGYDLSKDEENYKCCDYATRMREFVKLLFTVVIHNDSIKELLNNYPIDEVIEYVLGNDDDDEEEDDNGDEKADATQK